MVVLWLITVARYTNSFMYFIPSICILIRITFFITACIFLDISAHALPHDMTRKCELFLYAPIDFASLNLCLQKKFALMYPGRNIVFVCDSGASAEL
jgi:hypothetical protein